MKKLLHISESEGLCNCRIKFYPDTDGNWVPVEKMVSENKIFNPDRLEQEGWKKDEKKQRKEQDVISLLPDDRPQNEEYIDRACKRARSKLYDIIRCNHNLRYFCTLTFDSEHVDRSNYSEVVTRFNRWCDNRVRRNGLSYIGVAEWHKDKNGIHFHVLCNDVLKLVDSGTVNVKGRKKPIRISTADKYKIPVEDRKTVYNISDWSYGFSTAIEITGDPEGVKVARYIQKYLTKDSERVGGRWYYSGGELLRPKFRYCMDDFYESDDTYMINVPGNVLKVLLL